MKKVLLYIILAFVSFSVRSQTSKNKYVEQTISQKWELDSMNKKGTFRITSYKPTYVTAGRWSSNPNTQPYSENPDFSVPKAIAYNSREAKFQLSFKIKAVQSMLWGSADVWVGYTQIAHWQIYNKNISRVFRELNYEPEVIVNFPINASFLGFKMRAAGISFNHQSNGKDLPFSRSWNRIIFHAGFESNRWQFLVRPWIRLKDTEDENPLIVDYVGSAETTIGYGFKRMQISLISTHSFNKIGRGNYQVNYIFPLAGNLRAQVQFFRGYGETLIDYNHKQFTAGLGVSFSEW